MAQLKNNLEFSESMEGLTTETRVHADIINEYLAQLLSNTVALEKEVAALKAQLGGISFGTDENGNLTYEREDTTDEISG